MKEFIFNPINDKFPKGAVKCGETISYTLRVSKFLGVTNAYFIMHPEGKQDEKFEMTRVYVDEKYIHYSFSYNYTESGFYWYHFEVQKGDNSICLYRTSNLDVADNCDNNDYLQLIVDKESKIDKSFHKGIIYHIMVDRFNRVGDVKCRDGLTLADWDKPIEREFNEYGEKVDNICYGGTFAGITEKLSYLKSLNVSTIYLSPVFEANSNHKYNVADYAKLDSMYGTQDDFINLITEAKKFGMSIIIDGVFNHTGSDSVYFNRYGRYKTVGAYQSTNSKYYDWYEFINYPTDYSCWWGVSSLPQTREDSGFFDYIAGKNGIVEKYMKMGIGGFRLDVVDELSNKFLDAICSAVHRIDPKALIVGEVWEDASSKVSYDERKEYFLGGHLDSVTNYPMKNAILDYVKYGNVENFVSVVNLIKDQYPVGVQNNLMNIIDTHDTKRALTILGADTNNENYSENDNYFLSTEELNKGIRLLKIASAIQYTVMGIPTVYYGDEVGVEGMKDPFCRATFPWGNENKELLDWYIKLGELRKNKVFIDGDMNIKYAEDGVLIYERVSKDKKVIVAINRSEEEFEFILDKTMCDYLGEDYVNGRITLMPDELKIFVM